jgi:hypothetical protein
MPTKALVGMIYTPVGIRTASITASALWTRAFAQTKRKAISHAYAGWKSALIIISLANISAVMRGKLHGAKTTAALITVGKLAWLALLQWALALVANGLAIGIGRLEIRS